MVLKRWRETDFTRGRAKILLQVAPVLLFIAVWWIVALIMDYPRIYPTPLSVLQWFFGILAGKAEIGSSYQHIGATLYRLSVAFGLSFVLGSIIGLLIGRNKVLFDLFDNVGWVLMTVPAVVWSFIFVVAIGIKDIVPIGVLMAVLTPKVAIIVGEGAKATPTDILEMASSFKVTTWQRVKDVFVPHLVPYLVAGARIAFNLGVKVIMIAEIVGLSTGIGFMVLYWEEELFVGPLIAWGLTLIVIALVIEYVLFDRLERRVTKWRTVSEQAMLKKGE